MTDETMKILAPNTIRGEWLTGDLRRLILDTSGTTLVCYDPQTRTGGLYCFDPVPFWFQLGPCQFAGFIAMLPALGVTLPDGHDLQLWLDASTGDHVGGVQ
ncbi:MAG: hypothetical protein AB7V26_11530 [Lysobacterales bacterium]